MNLMIYRGEAIIWDYENNRDVFIIIMMVMLPLYNRDCMCIL